jgi:serine/threonine-protein kinase
MSWVPTGRGNGPSASAAAARAAFDPSAQEVTSVGKYRVLSELGRGGMANVYLAVTRGPSDVNKLVVLKALLPDLATEPAALTAFLDEARLAAQLNHGNVVQTYEVGTQGDRQVIVMEYLEGQSLASVMKRGSTAGTPLSLGFNLRILIDVLEGLQYAHELRAYDGSPLSLVHRDVSPQNVFVTYDGQVKVLDFGIAKAASSTIHTATGVVKGKISYMSPEQMVGESVDRRADVYSVGCMLWAAAAGRKLWKDTPDVHVMRAVMNGQIPSPQSVNPECDDELDQITMRSLALDCERRYQTAHELQEDLERYCERHGIQNRPRELGRYVAALFADTRAELRARVEKQLSVVSPEIGSRSQSDPALSALVQGVVVPSALSMAATGTISAISSNAVNVSAPAPARRKHAGLIAAAVAAAVVLSFWVWRASAPADAPAASAPPASALPPPKIENATVQLRSLPGDARLYLDGERLAGNPSTRVLPKDGKIHVLRAESDGYQNATAEFTVGKDDAVELRLEKLQSRPTVEAPPSAPVRTLKASKPKTAAPAAPNCAQPFFIDSDGIKKLRPACL